MSPGVAAVALWGHELPGASLSLSLHFPHQHDLHPPNVFQPLSSSGNELPVKEAMLVSRMTFVAGQLGCSTLARLCRALLGNSGDPHLPVKESSR